MTTISLEAFDGSLKDKLSLWILPSDSHSLPLGFQDQLLSGTQIYATSVFLSVKTDSKAWYLSYSWDMTFSPETAADWSLLISIFQHLKKPLLVVTSPTLLVPQAFWQKCMTGSNSITCVALSYIDSKPTHIPCYAIFLPILSSINELQLTESLQPFIKDIDHRSLYKELRGSGASICLIKLDSKSLQFTPMWFYPEKNTSLQLDTSEIKIILQTISDRL